MTDTPEGGRLTEAERTEFENRLRWHLDVVAEQGKGSSYISLAVINATATVERILAARATHADPRETAAAALDEAADAVPEFMADRVTWGDGTEFIAATAVQRELRARAADLRAGVREGRDT
jgi:IS30 family transposase